MKAFLIVVSAIFLLHESEATFGGHGGGNVALSGNFHGLLNHQKKENPPAEIIHEVPVETLPEKPAVNNGGGFGFSGSIHGLLKNHKLLSQFHGKKEQSEIVEVPVTHAPLPAHPAPSGSGFSLTGSIHGLLKNHRFLSGFNKNGQAATTEAPFDLGFDGDNTGYSVSTGNSEGPEIVESIVPAPVFTEQIDHSGISESSNGGFSSEHNGFSEASELPQPINDAPVVSGSASLSKSGGHNIHKILG